MTAVHFHGLNRAAIALAASTMLCPIHAAFAQMAEGSDIVVTAQKRSENLQDVPIAITAMGTEKLDELQVAKFEDYARYLPSVSYQTGGPGNAKVYFRGVASGENANHSTSQPSVGIYLDEQPITTIQGALDVHVYDVARVEALAGPQGSLYGASSEAGTIRIITNKPELNRFSAAVDVEVNSVAKGGQGHVFEGYVNAPIASNAAIRVVGWHKIDAGYINNIAGSLTFPSSGITMTNNALAKKDYNDVETLGGRAALKIDLDDSWTITPQLMGQKQRANGSFAVEGGLGDLETMQFNPERADDDWYQAALTVEGKIGNFDVTYAGAYLKRKVVSESDYSDYSYFYDALYASGENILNNAGDMINPNQYIHGHDRFTKQSHELRIASPSEGRVRFVGGLFYQRQSHNIRQDYVIDNLADDTKIPGTDSDVWLTQQIRVDRDYALFGELSYDITDKLAVTAGGRIYRYNNSLVGYFGLISGVGRCFEDAIVAGSPCTNVNKATKDTGALHKLNLTYKVSDDALVYSTVSRGYRPGGVNRRGSLPPYSPDFIDNYEIGFKTSWLDKRLRFNGAVYQLNWNDLQLSFLGANGLSEVRNAGKARIRGFETDVWARPVDGLTITAGLSYNDAKITRDFCTYADCAYVPGVEEDPNDRLAPAGTRLPVTAKLKANGLVRYEWTVGDMNAHVQGAAIYEGKRTTDLRTYEQGIKGVLPSYATFDFTTGLAGDAWTLEFYAVNLFDKRGYSTLGIQCGESVCGDPDGVTEIGGKIYRTPIQPRTIGLRAGYKF